MPVAGALVVVMLVAALLAREAWSLGALGIGVRARRGLDVAIVGLTVAFVAVVVAQLVTLT